MAVAEVDQKELIIEQIAKRIRAAERWEVSVENAIDEKFIDGWRYCEGTGQSEINIRVFNTPKRQTDG